MREVTIQCGRCITCECFLGMHWFYANPLNPTFSKWRSKYGGIDASLMKPSLTSKGYFTTDDSIVVVGIQTCIAGLALLEYKQVIGDLVEMVSLVAQFDFL
jgi:hypothetical protein